MLPHTPCRLRWSESVTTLPLLSLGFSCPFLLPSFFTPSNIRRVGQVQHEFATVTVQDRKSCQPSAVQYSNPRRYITVETRLLPHTGTKVSSKTMCMTDSPRQQPFSASTHYGRTTEHSPWQRGVRKYSTKRQKAEPSPGAKSTEIALPLTISKLPKKPLEKLRPKPKWVKAGIPRTKVKSTGRKVRRAAKKVKKGGPVGAAQRKNQGFLASIPSFDLEAYETAVLEGGPWRNLLEKVACKVRPIVKKAKNEGKAKVKREGDKVNASIVPIAMKANLGESTQKKEKQIEIPIAPGTGSRISIRGNGKIERMLGKGRNVLGTSPVTPIVPFETVRTFGTLAQLGMNGQTDGPPWKRSALEAKTVRSEEFLEVNLISIWSYGSHNFYKQKIHQ